MTGGHLGPGRECPPDPPGDARSGGAVAYHTGVRTRLALRVGGLLALAAPALAAPTAPGFKARLLDSGETVDTRELMGKKILVLRFQASYCKPCARESAALGRLAQRYRDRDVRETSAVGARPRHRRDHRRNGLLNRVRARL